MLRRRGLAIRLWAVQVNLMVGRITTLYRYPVKGFTPERRREARLAEGRYFPCDRLYAVENGPSGFDPLAPIFIAKSRFTVLAQIPKLALVQTAFDETTGILTARTSGRASFAGPLVETAGREAFAAWLTDFLGQELVNGPLRVLSAPPHAFTDSRSGFVSVVNLASVRDLSSRLGRAVNPLRFRANLYVDGWAPWAELDWREGGGVRLGASRAEVLKPIVRCLATHVDPETGKRDIDLVPALRDFYGHVLCGVYLNVVKGGRVLENDPADLMA
jgi:uncharacterized protein YcbX